MEITYTSSYTHDSINTMADKERRISERSLENLKLGAESRRLGKVRHNFTILPETVQWLKGTGNASDAIDGLVEAAKTGGLNSRNTHERIEPGLDNSINVYEREIQDLKRDLEETQMELTKTRSLLEQSRKIEVDTMGLLAACQQNGSKITDALRSLLQFNHRSLKWKEIKQQAQEVLELIDDV